MIGKLKTILLGNAAFAATAENMNERKQLALAALLVEMARADFDEQQAEYGAIVDLLSAHFGLSHTEAQLLVQRAQASSNKAVCLFDFTRALHDCLDENEKHEVITLLWKIASADRKLDKYEDYLVHKIAELLYVSRSDVLQIKHKVVGSS